mmetsp:Transcript_37448/g.110600  ORF Transcript_37448/g.110600 Transcript_37448/m.110600 type:complete len:240 (+) Transcript_37448:860-1579(+)
MCLLNGAEIELRGVSKGERRGMPPQKGHIRTSLLYRKHSSYARLPDGPMSLRRSCPWKTREEERLLRLAAGVSARTAEVWTPTGTLRSTGARRKRTTTPRKSTQGRIHSVSPRRSLCGGWLQSLSRTCGSTYTRVWTRCSHRTTTWPLCQRQRKRLWVCSRSSVKKSSQTSRASKSVQEAKPSGTLRTEPQLITCGRFWACQCRSLGRFTATSKPRTTTASACSTQSSGACSTQPSPTG